MITDKRYFFERNLLCLSASNTELCKRLTSAETSFAHYTFLTSRSGEIVPALCESFGKAHPLHSMMDPVKEAHRLISTLDDAGFLVILGLGGAFHIMAALERKDIKRIIIIDFNIHGIAELLASKEYLALFKDERVSLIIDPPAFSIEEYIINHYKPALFGGISVLPLRSRTDLDAEQFNCVCNEIKNAVDKISGDFSVQSLFGKRWFSHIIKNIPLMETQKSFFPTIHHAAIIGAGPSLDMQLAHLAEKRSSLFVISSDTAFPVLKAKGIIPDALISIDCQHYSSYHFIGNLTENIPLFLDMASPSSIAFQSRSRHFFTSAHPLSQYISRYWKQFPAIDTSGGNVSYAALSLAEVLGAKVIDLYGMDFSYPKGNMYARGTYIHKLFANTQNRFHPAESEFNHFLFRNTSLQKVSSEKTWYYETRMLNNYREYFEKKLSGSSARIHQIEGSGALINIQHTIMKQNGNIIVPFSAGNASMPAEDFLALYHDDIKKLDPEKAVSFFIQHTNHETSKENHLMMTLIPLASSLRKEHPKEDMKNIISMTKSFALANIEKVLSSSSME